MPKSGVPKKKSKKSVNYRHTTSQTKRCATCIHDLYKKGDKQAFCAIVTGPIESHDVCDEWTKK